MLNAHRTLRHRWMGPLLLASAAGTATCAMAADTLVVGQTLNPSQYLSSENGEYRLALRPDGDLVLERQSDRTPLWRSGTQGRDAKRLALSFDGELSIQSHGGAPTWTAGTQGRRASRLTLQNDGRLIMFDTSNRAFWTKGAEAAADISPAAAVSYVSSSIKQQKTGSTMVIARPASVALNDLMILAVATGPNGALVPTSAGTGWTRFTRCTVAGNADTACGTSGTDLGQALYYKRVTSSEPGGYTINKANGDTTLAVITAVRGAASLSTIKTFLDDGGDPDGDGTGSATASKTTCRGFAKSTGALNFCIMAHDDEQTFTVPSGWTKRLGLAGDDSALRVFTRSAGSDLPDTTFVYDVDRSPQFGNQINISFQIRP